MTANQPNWEEESPDRRKTMSARTMQHIADDRRSAHDQGAAQAARDLSKPADTQPDAALTRAHVQMIHDTALHALNDIPEAHWSYDPIWLISSSSAMLLRRLREDDR